MPRPSWISVLLLSLALLAPPVVGAEGTDRISALLTQMKEGHEEVRRLACDTLAEMGPDAQAAIPDLLAGLRDRTWQGRPGAARALLHIAPTDPAIIAAVAQALRDPSPIVRENTAFALGKVMPPATWAVPRLAELLKDKEWSVAYAASDAIEQLGPDAAPAVPALIGMMRATDDTVRSRAIRLLGKIGPEAKPALSTLSLLLASANAADRQQAARVLRDLAAVADAAIPALARATQDQAPQVRLDAAFTLGRAGYKQNASLPAFTPPLKREDQSIRLAFALGAAEAKDPNGRESMLKLLDAMGDSDKLLRNLAIDEAQRAGAAGIPTLCESLWSPDRKLRSDAAMILMFIARQNAVNQSPAAEPAIHALTRALKDPEPGVRGFAAAALANFHSPIAVPALLQAAREQAWDIRADAAWALGEVHGDQQARRTVINALKILLKDDNRYVRHMAARAIGHFGPDASDAVPLLIEGLSDRDEREILMTLPPRPLAADEAAAYEEMRKIANSVSVPSAAVVALGKIGPNARAAVPSLLANLKGSNGLVWRDVINTLGAIGPDAGAAIPALVKELPKDPGCYDAAAALAKMGEPGAEALVAALKNKDQNYAVRQELGRAGSSAIPTLIRALAEPDDEVRFSAARALGENGSRAAPAVPALIDAARNGSTSAPKTLAQIGPAAIPPLIELLKSTEWRTRELTSRALGELGPEAAPATQALADALEGGSPQSREAAA